MMLATLVSLALSNRMIMTRPNDIHKTAFDLSYVDADGTQTSITGGEGFYVAYREYDQDDHAGAIKLLTFDSEINTQSARVLIGTMEDRDPNNKRVHVFVQNLNPSKTLRFDVGIFADANFKSDNDTLSMIHNYRAFEISSAKNDGSVVMLIVNGSSYPSVNTLYLGELPHSESVEASHYPFWTNQIGNTTSTQDSVFAFSWHGVLDSGKSEKYGFIAVPNTTYSMEPFIRDNTRDFIGDDAWGDKELVFEVFDYDDSDSVEVYIDINGRQVKKVAVSPNPDTDRVSKVVKHDFYLNEGMVLKYSAYAVDKMGYKSNIINKTVYGTGAKKAKLTFDETPKKNYMPGDILHISGSGADEWMFSIKYRFDEQRTQEGDEDYYTYGSSKQFQLNVRIPQNLALGKSHKFKIWAVDFEEIESDPVEFEFQLLLPGEPFLSEVVLSEERVPSGKESKIVIYGDGSDPNVSQTVSVYAKIDGGSETFVGNFTSEKTLVPWAHFFTIPSTLGKGQHKVNVFLKDELGVKSSREWPLTILVWPEDETLPPAEIGQILDVSKETIHEPNTALFNLHYVSKDGIRSNMTFNDEGFYSAFRVHKNPDGGPFYETRLMKYSGENHTTMVEDNVNVTFSIENDTLTGYKRLKWTVINKNFFPRLFDLGVFADSDFSGDESSTIQERPDGLGIIVTNTRLGIHYTVFTRGVQGSQPVTNHFIKGMDRTGTNHIPVDQSPFFNKTTEKEPLKGVNAFYGFSWSQTINPDEETTFAVLVAAHDKVKTPPRIIDNTVLPDHFNAGDTLKVSFEVRDADINEKIKVTTTFIQAATYATEEHTHEYITNGSIAVFNYSYRVERDYFGVGYTLQAVELEDGANFPSNSVGGLAFISTPPSLSLSVPLEHHYHTKSKITLSGRADDLDHDIFTGMYQFTDGKYRSRAIQFPDRAIDFAGAFNFDIDIPSEVYPRDQDWGIVIYAVDELGAKSEERSYSFHLNAYSPPSLMKAGLIRKFAKAGEQILGYAVLSDKQKQNVRIFVKLGTEQEYPKTSVALINNEMHTGDDKPVAFYWTVPKVPTQIADVYFIARDYDDLDSEPIRQTLIITA